MGDMVMRGALAGLIGMAACAMINLIFYILGWVPTTGFHYNAILLHAPDVKMTTLTMTSSVIAGFVTGAFVGVITSFLIEKTGYDYAWIKGLGIGVVLWPVHVTFIPAMIPRLYTVLPPSIVFACFFFEAIFGAITGIMIYRFAKQSVSN